MVNLLPIYINAYGYLVVCLDYCYQLWFLSLHFRGDYNIGPAGCQESGHYGINRYHPYFQYYRTGEMRQYAVGNTFLFMIT